MKVKDRVFEMELENETAGSYSQTVFENLTPRAVTVSLVSGKRGPLPFQLVQEDGSFSDGIIQPHCLVALDVQAQTKVDVVLPPKLKKFKLSLWREDQ